MKSPKERLEELDLPVRQAARLLQVSRRVLSAALDEVPPPRWLQYALEGLEETLRRNPGLRARSVDDLPEPLAGLRWAATTARLAIPVLVGYAKRREKLTYKKLDEELRKKAPHRGDAGTLTKYAFALGRVGRTLLILSEKHGIVFPPIEALVVNGVTDLPGDGIDYFLKSYLIETGRTKVARRLHIDRAGIIKEIQREIFDFGQWKHLLNEVTGLEQ